MEVSSWTVEEVLVDLLEHYQRVSLETGLILKLKTAEG
jgi:hypothetical protein